MGTSNVPKIFGTPCILFLFINIGIIIFVTAILKIKIISIYNYLHYCKIHTGYNSNSFNISDYVNVVEITSTQYYTRLAKKRLPEQKMLGNYRMETASTKVKLTRRRNGIEKSTCRTHRYFIDFESRNYVEISTLNRCHNFHMDLSFNIHEISANCPYGILTSN